MQTLKPDSVRILEKLDKLDCTADSICSTSEYCRFYGQVLGQRLFSTLVELVQQGLCAQERADCPLLLQEAHKLVALWETAFDRSRDSNKRLALMYLANDILQNSRKKGHPVRAALLQSAASRSADDSQARRRQGGYWLPYVLDCHYDHT